MIAASVQRLFGRLQRWARAQAAMGKEADDEGRVPAPAAFSLALPGHSRAISIYYF